MNFQIKDKTYVIINGQEIIFPRDKHWYPASVLFGIKDDGSFYPIKITDEGKLVVTTDLQISDIQIGSVEIKDSDNDIRLNITQEGLESAGLKGIVVFGKDTDGKVRMFLFDNQGQLLVSSPYLNDIITAINQKLDVNLSTRASEQTLSQILSKVLPLSFDDNQKLLTNVTDSVISIKDYITGLKLNVINNNQDLSGITGILVFGKDDQNKSRTLLFDNDGNLVISSDQLNNIINILTGKLDVTLSTRASELTLSSIKTDTSNLDVPLSSRLSEQTGLQILTKLLPLTFDDQNKLLVSADIGTVEIKDGNVKLNLIGEGLSVLNLNGILVFGKDNQNNARLLLFDDQNRLIVSDPTVVDLLNFLIQRLDVNLSSVATEQTLSQILTKLNYLTFDDQNRLLVNQIVPPPPPSTEPFNIVLKSNVTGSSIYDYTVPNGKTVVLTAFIGGAEASTAGSKVELYYTLNGVNFVTLAVGYVNGSNCFYSLNDSVGPGNGTIKIRIVRTRFDGGAREIFVRVTGYIK
jgi:hypothetical protein